MLANVFVARKTSTGQAAVEQYHNNVYGRVGDVLGQRHGGAELRPRFAAEMQAMRTIMAELLAAQYPVLTWWGLLTVLTRVAATITVVAIYAVGAVLAARGEITVGEIVAFVGFAGLLIGKLDLLYRASPCASSSTRRRSRASSTCSTPPTASREARRQPLADVAGNVRYEGVTFRVPEQRPGRVRPSLEAPAGETVALVGPTGAGKTTTLALLQRLRALDRAASSSTATTSPT